MANAGIRSNIKKLNLYICKMCEPFYLCIYTFANRKITSETQSLCEQVPDDKSEKKCQKLE